MYLCYLGDPLQLVLTFSVFIVLIVYIYGMLEPLFECALIGFVLGEFWWVMIQFDHCLPKPFGPSSLNHQNAQTFTLLGTAGAAGMLLKCSFSIKMTDF